MKNCIRSVLRHFLTLRHKLIYLRVLKCNSEAVRREICDFKSFVKPVFHGFRKITVKSMIFSKDLKSENENTKIDFKAVLRHLKPVRLEIIRLRHRKSIRNDRRAVKMKIKSLVKPVFHGFLKNECFKTLKFAQVKN